MLTECSHAATLAARTAAIAGLPQLLLAMSTHCGHLHTPSADGTVQLSLAVTLHQLSRTVQTTVEQGEWAGDLSPACKFLLFHMLTMLPWSKQQVQPWITHAPQRVGEFARALGRIFDNMLAQPYKLRRWICTWAQWSGRTCLSLAAAWAGHTAAAAAAQLRLLRYPGGNAAARPMHAAPRRAAPAAAAWPADHPVAPTEGPDSDLASSDGNWNAAMTYTSISD